MGTISLNRETDRVTATYVGYKAEEESDAPPDPGAMAAAIFLRGMFKGLQ